MEESRAYRAEKMQYLAEQRAYLKEKREAEKKRNAFEHALILSQLNLAIMQQEEMLANGLGGSMPLYHICLLYTSPSPRDKRQSRMPSSA